MDAIINVLAITFHRAENYGSMLQAFALQEFVKGIRENVKYNILDYAPNVQKNLYRIIPHVKDIKSAIKAIVSLKYYRKLCKKKNNFKNFISVYLQCTHTVDSSKENLKSVVRGTDLCIFGSDQIWNTNGEDFDWIYMGEGISGYRKISYAASMGSGYFVEGWDKDHREKTKQLLNEFMGLSVRERGAYKAVMSIKKNSLEVSQNIDPIFLLSKEEWISKLRIREVNKEKYILFYSLNPDKLVMEMVKEIENKLRIPVVVTKFNNMHDIINPFEKKYDTGPIEFLELLYNAELIVSTSFHGVAFSILFNKPFYAINPYSDSRLESILTFCALEDRSIKNVEDINNIKNEWLKIEFSSANHAIEIERKKSKDYLVKYVKKS